MLTVPDSIKALFRTDGVQKNFRVQFPDGELPDLTNSDVVTESVAFTESVMSQTVFTYGTAERSVIEFETVGVPNIYGMRIFCGIEIDTGSLSAADLSAIAADPGDGVLVMAADSDLGWGYYRIPYGYFRVVSCPRNKENMARRRVRGMSATFDSPIEMARLSSVIPYKTYKDSLWRTAAAVIGYWDPTAPERLMGCTKGVAASWAAIQAHEHTITSTATGTIGGNPATIKIITTRYDLPFNGSVGTMTIDGIYKVELTGKWAAPELFNRFCSDVKALGLVFDADPGQTQEYALGLYKTAFCSYVNAGGLGGYGEAPTDGIGMVEGGDFVFDLWVNGSNWELEQMASVVLRRKVSYTISVGGEVVASGDDNAGSGQSAVIYELYPPNNIPTLTIPVVDSKKLTAGGETRYQHKGAYDPVAVGMAWAELNAWLMSGSRGEKRRVIQLDNSSPVSIGPDDTESLWWDEYDILPIGTTYFMAGARTNLKDNVLTDGSVANPIGGSVYDLRENELANVMTAPSRTNMVGLIQKYFLPGTASLYFTPAELTMRAWPWIEAGDALEITTAGGETVNTFALRQTIRGIQLLRSEIEAPSGEVLED